MKLFHSVEETSAFCNQIIICKKNVSLKQILLGEVLPINEGNWGAPGSTPPSGVIEQGSDLLKVTALDVSGTRVIANTDYKMLNDILVSIIVRNVQSEILTKFNEEKDTIRVIWEKLNALYHRTSNDSIHSISVAIHNRKQQSGERAEDYGAALTQMVHRYNELCGKEEMADRQVASIIMHNADPRYSMTFEAIKATGIFSSTRVLARMMDFDETYGLNVTATIPIVAPVRVQQNDRHSHNRGVKYCTFCHMSNHNSEKCWRRKKHLNSGGYRKKSFRRPRGGNDNTNNHNNLSGQANSQQHNHQSSIINQNLEDNKFSRPHQIIVAALVNPQIMFIGDTNYTTNFIVDTGAAIHITGNKELLHDYCEVEPISIQGFNSQQRSVAGKGTIHFKYTYNKEILDCYIRNVHYVDGIHCNVLSVSTLVQSGTAIQFNNFGLTVKANDHVVINAKILNRLFIANLETIPTHQSPFTSTVSDQLSVVEYKTEHPVNTVAAQTQHKIASVSARSATAPAEEGESSAEPTLQNNQSAAPLSGQSSSADAVPLNDESTCVNNTADPAVVNTKALLWHKRFGHIAISTLSAMTKSENILGMPQLKNTNIFCEPCILAKQAAASHSKHMTRTTGILQLLHIDVGFFDTPNCDGYKCYLVVVDDYSRYVVVYQMYVKAQAYDIITQYINWAQTQRGVRVQRIRSDNAPEFNSHKLTEFYKLHGIQREFTAPYSPEQNGVAERMNRTLKEGTRALLINSGQGVQLWGYALKTTAYTHNLVIHSTTNKKTPHELFFNTVPTID